MSDLRTPLATAIAISLCLGGAADAGAAGAAQDDVVRTAVGQQRFGLDGVREGALSAGGPRRHLPPVSIRHDRIPGVSNRARRHRDDRRPAERAILLPRQGRLPDHRRHGAGRQGIRRGRAQGDHQAAGPRRQDRRDTRRVHGVVVHLRVSDQEWRRPVEGDNKESGYPGPACGAVRRRHRGLLHLAAGRITHARDLRRTRRTT